MNAVSATPLTAKAANASTVAETTTVASDAQQGEDNGGEGREQRELRHVDGRTQVRRQDVARPRPRGLEEAVRGHPEQLAQRGRGQEPENHHPERSQKHCPRRGAVPAAGQVFGEAPRDQPRRSEPFDDPPLRFQSRDAALLLVPYAFAEVILDLGENAPFEAASPGELSSQLVKIIFDRPRPANVAPSSISSTARENSR